MRKHLHTARQPEVIRTALRFALVVGPILVFINHGDAILAGSMDATAWLKSALTMVVPYTVSTLSSISAYHSCRSTDQND
ncbi:MAG: nitrate/nitrite transporter NrtS [Mariprofundus sp.]